MKQDPSDQSSTPIKLETSTEKLEIPNEASENCVDPSTTPAGMPDSTSEYHSQQKPTQDLKPRCSVGRRTSEQRLASTQRWEARKKARLAATGENDSDTDSIASDEDQLSPIQKARAKNNAEKEAERQRRLSKACNNLNQGGALGSSATESYLQKLPENNIQMKFLDKTDDFIPQSVQNEIIIGDATYVVTSTLLLTEPSISRNQQNQQSYQMKEKITEDLPNYQNTDIMDAVKLKRVNPPLPSSQRDKKLIERCVNIEVEGTELPTLQKVQTELAKFIENEMKHKLTNNGPPVEEKVEPKPQDSEHTLEQKLKRIIEKTIKDNVENSRMKRVPISKITTSDRIHKTFSSAFIKAAMKSHVFQPKVVLSRFQLPKLETESMAESTRRAGGNHSNTLKFQVGETKRLLTPSRKTCSVKVSHTPNILKSSRLDFAINENPYESTRTLKDSGSNVEKHICGLCGNIFPSKLDVEIHYEIHRSSNAANQAKHKMLRCKRCHEVVAFKFVKTHVCKTSKYKCEICHKVFKIQSWLERHLMEQHEDRGEQTRNGRPSLAQIDVKPPALTSSLTPETLSSSSNLPPVVILDDAPQRVYSCFICDKNFRADEILKDHLQEHCEDLSEVDQVPEEKVYQCAICGENLDSESGLENHVEKHLFDDEDDNPNLINIEGLLHVKINRQLHTCVQCAQQFNTELNLVMHMQQHEEDAAFAEWGKQGLKMQDNYACTICAETFDTEETLANHLDLHNANCHICELCDRPFWTIGELQEHVVSHCT